jgi:tetratricopeptide (TPR) repeat protein
LAQRAVQLAPQVHFCWNALGVALYRSGNPQKAIDALSQSLKLNKDGTGSDFFFLAMANQQLKNTAQARQWYDRAVQWMNKNEPKDEELRRFRNEAEEALGLKPARELLPAPRPVP